MALAETDRPEFTAPVVVLVWPGESRDEDLGAQLAALGDHDEVRVVSLESADLGRFTSEAKLVVLDDTCAGELWGDPIVRDFPVTALTYFTAVPTDSDDYDERVHMTNGTQGRGSTYRLILEDTHDAGLLGDLAARAAGTTPATGPATTHPFLVHRGSFLIASCRTREAAEEWAAASDSQFTTKAVISDVRADSSPVEPKPTHEKLRAAGRIAFQYGEPRAPGAAAIVRRALEGLEVGTPDALAAMQAWTEGYEQCADEAAAEVLADEEAERQALRGRRVTAR